MPLPENTDKLLLILKTKGPQTANSLANLMNMTSMGARHHLNILEEKSLVSGYDSHDGVGRPKRYWKLTEKAMGRFPDTHSFLTIEIIDSIKKVFGDKGIDKIIHDRAMQTLKKYQEELQLYQTLGDKIRKLVVLRSQEGYMAEYRRNSDGSYILSENHCPICAAASKCQQFCKSELAIFQQVLGNHVQITRESHILEGARRCVYLIKLK